MNVAQMLAMTVTPLSAYGRAERPPHERNTEVAVRTKRNCAMKRYADAIGTGWTRTAVIEQKLGYSRGTAYKTLLRLEVEGKLERRAAVPVPGNTKAGWEWRVK